MLHVWVEMCTINRETKDICLQPQLCAKQQATSPYHVSKKVSKAKYLNTLFWSFIYHSRRKALRCSTSHQWMVYAYHISPCVTVISILRWEKNTLLLSFCRFFLHFPSLHGVLEASADNEYIVTSCYVFEISSLSMLLFSLWVCVLFVFRRWRHFCYLCMSPAYKLFNILKLIFYLVNCCRWCCVSVILFVLSPMHFCVDDFFCFILIVVGVFV